ADLINSGSLPFDLKDSELRSVGPTLGSKALETSLKAALIGVILVMLFMLIVYRLPGLVADLSLIAYISLSLLIMAGFFYGDGVTSGYRVTLTLPGIAGVILSIGMAVDANVVIFERIKDELRQGKSVGAAVDGGFKRAITAVIDSNVTTVIACVVLYFFGSGTIKGFATTLLIGIIVSMFTAIFLTKLLLKLIVGFGVKNTALYGVNKRRDA
ncbi:MAG: SecD/SecF family protein translocase subunit, partial [Clostridia bacterium]